MSCEDDTAWREARLVKLRALIDAYDDAILQLSTGAVMQYSIDTGQTRQTVTKQQISQIKNVRDSLANEYETLRARLCGAGVNVRPVY